MTAAPPPEAVAGEAHGHLSEGACYKNANAEPRDLVIARLAAVPRALDGLGQVSRCSVSRTMQTTAGMSVTLTDGLHEYVDAIWVSSHVVLARSVASEYMQGVRIQRNCRSRLWAGFKRLAQLMTL
jgi:hypothetical protein